MGFHMQTQALYPQNEGVQTQGHGWKDFEAKSGRAFYAEIEKN